MAYLNERWFNANDTLAEAKGHGLGASIRARHGGPASRPNGGIRHPLRTIIPAGTSLVRFDGSSRPAVARNGKWWLTFAEYARVQAFADNQAMSIPAAVAELCCVPEEWNDMHVVIQARVKQPLLAYTGAGREAHGRDRHYPERDAGGHPVVQVYLPGMHDTNVHDGLAITGYGFLPGR